MLRRPAPCNYRSAAARRYGVHARAPERRCEPGLLARCDIASAAGLRRSWAAMHAWRGVGKGSSRSVDSWDASGVPTHGGPRAGGRFQWWGSARSEGSLVPCAARRTRTLGCAIEAACPRIRPVQRACRVPGPRRGAACGQEAPWLPSVTFSGRIRGRRGVSPLKVPTGRADGAGLRRAGPRRLEAGATHTLSLPPPWPPWASRP